MTNPESIYECPVCLGVKLSKVKMTGKTTFFLDYCPRCGGMWFDKGEVQQLQQFKPDTVAKRIELRETAFQMRCHSCHAYIDRNAAHCPVCHWQNALDCPICNKRMKTLDVQNMRLDICKHCKGVWFDQIELAQLWNLNFEKLKKDKSKRVSVDGEDVAEFFLDVFIFAPDLAIYGTAAAAEIGVEALKLSGHVLSNAPEIAGTVIESAGDIAGSIFEAIVEILSDIF